MNYFENVIGQERNKKHIETMLKEGTLPHSLLIYGEKGLGKFTMAKAIASTILKRDVFVDEVEQGHVVYIDHGDVFWVRPMKKSGLKIEQWQTVLREYLTQVCDGPRIVIIEDFNTARADFANAILKSIEEPPANVYFIIITTKKQLVLPTILSRCMLIPFVEVSKEELVKQLEKEGYGMRAEEAAILSQGNYGKAKAYLEDEHADTLQTAFELMEVLAEKEHPITQFILKLQNIEKETIIEIMGWMRMIARDIMALQFDIKESQLQFPKLKARLLELAKFWNVKALQAIYKETLKAESALQLNIRVALVVDAISIELKKALKE